MTIQQQTALRAMYMRGGTSKGVFFVPEDFPAALQRDQAARDRMLLKVIGSPDPYAQHIDGMGGATSSTSKVVLVSKSSRPDCDVDYYFGQVAIDKPLVDWSGNCGNLSAAVGPFAIHRGLIAPIENGTAVVRIWQANIQKKIIAHVPVSNGRVVELGDFELDGVTFPAAEIKLEFIEPGASDESDTGAMFPTGNLIDTIHVPGLGNIKATLINAGNPSIFVEAEALGLTGIEMQKDVNNNPQLLQKLETLRAHGAVKMGLAKSPEDASANRQHTPKLAFFSKPKAYVASSGKAIDPSTIDVTARIMSMGKLHHAMTGTGAVAISVASAIKGTIVSNLLGRRNQEGPQVDMCFAHPSGCLRVGAEVAMINGQWVVQKSVMSRSARRLMDGQVLVHLT